MILLMIFDDICWCLSLFDDIFIVAIWRYLRMFNRGFFTRTAPQHYRIEKYMQLASAKTMEIRWQTIGWPCSDYTLWMADVHLAITWLSFWDVTPWTVDFPLVNRWVVVLQSWYSCMTSVTLKNHWILSPDVTLLEAELKLAHRWIAHVQITLLHGWRPVGNSLD